MFRMNWLRWMFVASLCALWLWMPGIGCSGGPSTETNDPPDTSVPEAKPEPPAPREQAPDKELPPQGLGDKCEISAVSSQGTCPNDRLLCGPITSDSSICFENCTKNNKCTADGEQCVNVRELSKFPVCVTVAKKDQPCGLDKRTICPGEIADPPLFCVDGKCTERPKDGWDVGAACSPPKGNEQSDCKTGLICVEHAKNIYLCAKKCEQDSDCPSGETCWEEPLQKKVCVTAVKIGGKCDKLKRLFCKTENPLNPVSCKDGTCKGEKDLAQVDEPCTKSSLPGEERGSCDNGLVCLGVSDRASLCHKSCTSTADCPNGESCINHPNPGPGDPLKACVVEVGAGATCDLTARKMCKQEPGKFFKCLRPDETTNAGTCTEVKIGDGCVNDDDCGSMLCLQIDPQNNPTKKYCLVGCDPKAPACPDGGACSQWGGMNGPFACNPVGPQGEDEPCIGLQATGDKLNTTKLCKGGLVCPSFAQGNPAGICMKAVAQCTADACSPGHVCLPVQAPLCGLDCTNSTSVCKPGTTCAEIKIGNATFKICGPTL